MKAIQLDSLNAISTAPATGEDREFLTAKWAQVNEHGVSEKFDGQFFLLKKIGFGAQLRLLSAGSLTDQTVALLVERIRFGEKGEEKLTYEKARELVESDSPLIAAICNAAWAHLKEMKEVLDAEAAVGNAPNH